MKRYFLLVIASIFLIACSSNNSGEEIIADSGEISEGAEIQGQMMESGVKLYLSQMINRISTANTENLQQDYKMLYLERAITDIDAVIQEIEDNYEVGMPPAEELLELAAKLKLSIEAEMNEDDESAEKNAFDASVILEGIASEYLDGELPIDLQKMFGIENADD